MKITFRLMQDSGVQGPHQSFEMENPDPHPVALARWARDWSKGQTGHPWDTLTYEYESTEGFVCRPVQQLAKDGPTERQSDGRSFYSGWTAGATAYAEAVGHSARLSANKALKDTFARGIMASTEWENCPPPSHSPKAKDGAAEGE